MTRCVLVVAAGFAATLPASGAEPPPPLGGAPAEALVASSFSSIDAYTLDCATGPNGESTLSWTVTGTAVGPYPGTFTETGSLTFAAEPGEINGFPAGPVLTFEASFEIDSPVGQVTGTKSLLLDAAGLASCGETTGPLGPQPAPGCVEGDTFIRGSYLEGVVGNRYEATIVTEAGSFRDSGTASTTFLETSVLCEGRSRGRSLFVENFSGSGGVVPLFPTSADQCKKDGWRAYPAFRNQGDCVAFVATEGRNEPGQNVPGLP